MKPRFKAPMALITLALLLPWQGFAEAAEQSENISENISKEEIEQLVAPIALYPDPLLAQILMASTYPLEIVSAARFVRENPDLKNNALEEALLKQPWDESVKSLVAMPQVLAMLNEKLDMTQKLGDVFLAQQKNVLHAIQSLRNRAQDAGNLQSSKEQVVNVQEEGDSSYISIEPADPEVVYVPSYDPNSIYGSWPYEEYPPYEYYPPGYVARSSGFYYGAGLATGYALWGNFNWRDGVVGITINRYNNYFRTNISNGTWRHHVEHRRGVQYRDRALQNKFGKGQLKDSEARKAFRGRAEQGREELRRDQKNRPSKQPSRDRIRQDRQRPSPGDSREQSRDRQRSSIDRRQRQPNRPAVSQRFGAFDGVDHGRDSRNYSQRGRSSRPSSGITRGGGGGGNRGAGGRGGRGGGRRR